MYVLVWIVPAWAFIKACITDRSSSVDHLRAGVARTGCHSRLGSLWTATATTTLNLRGPSARCRVGVGGFGVNVRGWGNGSNRQCE